MLPFIPISRGLPAPRAWMVVEPRGFAQHLGEALSIHVYPQSVFCDRRVFYFIARRGIEKLLGLACQPGEHRGVMRDFRGQTHLIDVFEVKIGPADHANARALRKHLPFTRPALVGIETSIGCGDRLGLATPGHIRAVRGTGVKPYFAQQSIREMTRTQRTADEVMDAATWGVFQEGWREGFGSDADHLKTAEDVDVTVAAGFTMFTIDPGAHVDNAADSDSSSALAQKFNSLPWVDLEDTAADCRGRYLGKRFHMADGLALELSDERLQRAAAKYGRAVAHTAKLFRHLAARMGTRPFELEMSVDETATPTSVEEHFFVASELKRLGVKWVSLAPRFIGEFEKGVDYKGDLAAFERSFAQHVAVARHLGPYKLSIHSGSDKFSVYPIAARLTGGLVHVKTAGTSYLEALRALAGVEPGLFREILDFARERYETDKASYHVSANPSKVPTARQLKDGELASVLDLFDGREVVHVTFGSVLTLKNADGQYRFRDRLLLALRQNEEAHYAALEKHLGRHISPFRS